MCMKCGKRTAQKHGGCTCQQDKIVACKKAGTHKLRHKILMMTGQDYLECAVCNQKVMAMAFQVGDMVVGKPGTSKIGDLSLTNEYTICEVVRANGEILNLKIKQVVFGHPFYKEALGFTSETNTSQEWVVQARHFDYHYPPPPPKDITTKGRWQSLGEE